MGMLELLEELAAHRISRREFVNRSLALGVAAPAIAAESEATTTAAATASSA